MRRLGFEVEDGAEEKGDEVGGGVTEFMELLLYYSWNCVREERYLVKGVESLYEGSKDV